jgi:uncharacterized protein YbjQ (UPF0145 family)
MQVTNLEYLPWQEIIEHFGLVNWSTVRAKHFWRDFMAWLKNIVWWELKWYTELLEESRKEAINRMVAQARELWANAILNVRFSTSSVSAWASEIYVYGTAVKILK